jgi:hypothetical protein
LSQQKIVSESGNRRLLDLESFVFHWIIVRLVKIRIYRPHPRGFALVVTVSLLVLLAVVAVGLLSLASVSLRTSSATEAQATARANAKVALMLALGDLQRAAGPDQRITAPGSILGATTAHPYVTGVWRSWEIQPLSPPAASDYERNQGKKDKFEGWLVSHGNPDAVRTNADFPSNGSFGADALTLLSRQTLGTNATASDEVRAGRVPLRGGASNSITGTLGWAVLDEAVKARVNLGESLQNGSAGLSSLGLGTGQRPSVERLAGMEALANLSFDLGTSASNPLIDKLISLPTLEILAGKFKDKTTPRFHDLTTCSLGLLTDTARGGLRRDLSLLAENTILPAPYDKGVYASELGITIPSDPMWQQLAEYAKLFKSPELRSNGGLPSIRMHAPAGWPDPLTGGLQNPPPGMVVAPVIAKVQMIFSILARDIYRYSGAAGTTIPATAGILHEPWGTNFRASSYKYLLHLLYTPVVTLWNPYNVELECENLQVEFKHVPFALKVFRNGVAQTTDFAPLDQMYGSVAETQQGQLSKIFVMNLKDKTPAGTPSGSGIIRLLPGEVKLFSPYINPNRSFLEEAAGPLQFWDWQGGVSSGSLTLNIDAISGWRGDGIGFDLDWFCPEPMRVDSYEREGTKAMWRDGTIGLRRDDRIHLEFTPRSIPLSDHKFTVSLMDSGNANKIHSVMEIDYEKADGLQEQMLGAGGSIRFPQQGSYTVLQLLDGQGKPLKDYVNPKSFAILSAYAKTTHGGMDGSAVDGRHATRPWVFNNPVSPVVFQKVLTEHPAHHSHEIDLTLLDGDTDEFIDVGANDRGRFITGHTVFNGRTSGTHSEIPLAPPQTLTAFNAANLTASGMLPRFAQPLGNSLAHPVMSCNQIVEQATPSGYPYADHSFLLNLALFDGWFCSGLQDRTGSRFLDSTSLADQRNDFLAGKSLLPDPRLTPYLPHGMSAAQASNALSNEATAFRSLAALILVRGPFNVHSTSVDAWKSVLSAMLRSEGFQIRPDGTFSNLSAANGGDARFSRFRVPNSEASRSGSDPTDTAWSGPRDLSESELDSLARAIVAEIRERGPFLSLAEFVNRRVGPASAATSLRGALQAAIDKSGINAPLATATGFQIDEAKVSSLRLRTPEAATGPSGEGAPGMLTQADLLTVLGNTATVRADTFRIRAFGDARDPSGRIVAKAWCEAVVQRLPGFVDPADAPETAIKDLTSPSNSRFGRRFHIVSFRWLTAGEV